MCHNQKFLSHRWLIPLILFPSVPVSFTAANIILQLYKQTARRQCGWLCAGYNFFAFIILIDLKPLRGSTSIVFIDLSRRSFKNIFSIAFRHRLLPSRSQKDTLLHYIWFNRTFQCYGAFFRALGVSFGFLLQSFLFFQKRHKTTLFQTFSEIKFFFFACLVYKYGEPSARPKGRKNHVIMTRCHHIFALFSPFYHNGHPIFCPWLTVSVYHFIAFFRCAAHSDAREKQALLPR